MEVTFIATPDMSYVSGSSLSLKYTAEALVHRGTACTVLCQRAPRDRDSHGVNYIEVPIPLDYQVITNYSPSTPDLTACVTMITDVAASLPRIDVVHAVYGTFTGTAALLTGALRSVPVVITTFGRDVEVGATFDSRYAKMMEIAYRGADLVVAADGDVAARVQRGYRLADGRIRVIPPGMNLSMLRRVRAAAAAKRRSGSTRRSVAGAFRILAVQSSFNEQKGLKLLINALPAICDDFPAARVVVVGHDDTPDRHLARELEALAHELDVSRNLEFVGHLEHHQVATQMMDSDVFVDPRTINSFSSCVVEAMTMGIPVVASSVPCNIVALGQGSRGSLTDPASTEALARDILAVLRGGEPARRRVEAASAYAAGLGEVLDCEVIAAHLEEEYRALLAP